LNPEHQADLALERAVTGAPQFPVWFGDQEARILYGEYIFPSAIY
jgi:hypothetical protein